jgi:hypothetical protein
MDDIASCVTVGHLESVETTFFYPFETIKMDACMIWYEPGSLINLPKNLATSYAVAQSYAMEPHGLEPHTTLEPQSLEQQLEQRPLEQFHAMEQFRQFRIPKEGVGTAPQGSGNCV